MTGKGLTILFDPNVVKNIANNMLTIRCCKCGNFFTEDEVKDGFCVRCWTGIIGLIGELGDE